MKLPKLVIFDMDGLIFDSERLFMNLKNEILKEYGYPAQGSDYVQTLGLAGQQLLDKLAELYGPDYPAQEISDRTRQAVTAYVEEHGPDVKPGIRELLQYLQSRNIPCCVASSTRHEYVAKYLKRANLDSFFTFIIGGDEISVSKPAPDIFLAACLHYEIAPEDALVLEDSENGIRAALNGGIPVVCIPDLMYPRDELITGSGQEPHSGIECGRQSLEQAPTLARRGHAKKQTATVIKRADDLIPLLH